MSNATQAFVMTAVLFGLSFVAIFLFWFAEKFRPIRGPKIRR
jgi:multisubunit Na+/H+ antiporter MnhC subunit